MTALVLGCGVGAGLLLAWLGAFPPRPTLASALAALTAPPGETATPTANAGVVARLGLPLVPALSALGLPRHRTRTDLAVCDRSRDIHIAEQATLAVTGLVLPTAATGLAALAGTTWAWPVPLWLGLAAGCGGLLAPDLMLRGQARRRRADMTYALSAWLDLTVIGLAGGAGIEQAISQAAATGSGWAYGRLQHALTVARRAHQPIWVPLTDLASQVDVAALAELAAALRLAGEEGARIRASLTSRAAALRLHQLTTAETEANAASERMSLPIVVMLTAFLALIGYPAATAVLTGL